MTKLCLLSTFIIGLVSAFDNSLSVIYQDELMRLEENPVGIYLLTKGLDVFVTAKALTTMLVVLVCFLFTRTKYRSAVIIVGLFQIGLFWYLNYSETYVSGEVIIFGRADTSPVEQFVRMQTNFWTKER